MESYPWQDPKIRDAVQKVYNLRLPEAYLLKLKSIAEQTPSSMQKFCYEAHVGQDLWGGWVLTCIWGRRGTALGQVRRVPCASYAEALDQLATVAKLREKRGYAAMVTGP